MRQTEKPGYVQVTVSVPAWIVGRVESIAQSIIEHQAGQDRLGDPELTGQVMDKLWDWIVQWGRRDAEMDTQEYSENWFVDRQWRG
jgi:hypothetical protein